MQLQSSETLTKVILANKKAKLPNLDSTDQVGIVGLSAGFKFNGASNLWISGQFGLHVKVIKRFGKPTWLHIAIPSK